MHLILRLSENENNVAAGFYSRLKNHGLSTKKSML